LAIEFGVKVVDVGILQFSDVPLEYLGFGKIVPDKGSPGRNQFTGGENRNFGSPLDPDVSHSTSGEKRTRNERNPVIQFSNLQRKPLPFLF
jgi:hypothetical protein